MDAIVGIIAIAIIVVPLFGIVACVFQWQLYLSDPRRPRSWLLYSLAMGSTVATICAIVMSMLATLRFAGISLQGLGAILLALMVLLLECIPIGYAVQLYVRRRRGNGS